MKNKKDYIKYLCIMESNDNINICLREDNKYFYIDFNKNDLYVNLCKKDKVEFEDLLKGKNKGNQKQTYITICTMIITDYLLNVKSVE